MLLDSLVIQVIVETIHPTYITSLQKQWVLELRTSPVSKWHLNTRLSEHLAHYFKSEMDLNVRNADPQCYNFFCTPTLQMQVFQYNFLYLKNL